MRPDRRPIIGVTMGDPAGIGPEVVAKALSRREVLKLCRPLVIGSKPVMEWTVKGLKLKTRICPVQGHDQALGRAGEIPVLDPLERPLTALVPGRLSKQAGDAAVQFIKTAVRLAQDHCLEAIVTAPISKEGMHLAGYPYPGHTELLAELTRSRDVGMMIVGGPLKIQFVTTHVAIRDLPAALTVDRIERAIRLAARALRDYFGIAVPRIGVAALNPHAGERGLFGDEERKAILPALHRARSLGLAATGPLPADTLFGKAVRGEYDGVVAMFHDQGLIPLKLMAFGRCVNLTVGLPIIRTSVDHGTAYDIAGKGVADPGSLIEAIRLAVRLAKQRVKPEAYLVTD
jgi:4-hydroxythreonine-4-phosphate dehydrogenase